MISAALSARPVPQHVVEQVAEAIPDETVVLGWLGAEVLAASG